MSPYLTEVLMAGDKLKLRGPIGGYFAWEARDGGPLSLVAPLRIHGALRREGWGRTTIAEVRSKTVTQISRDGRIPEGGARGRAA